MDASQGSRPAASFERRIAENGHPYTREQFMKYYGPDGELRWTEADARGPPTVEDDATNQQAGAMGSTDGPPTDENATQPPVEDDATNQQAGAMGSTKGPPTDGNAAQLPVEDDATNQQAGAMGSTEGPPTDGGAAQVPTIPVVPAVHAPPPAAPVHAVLLPHHVVAIQNAEAARGPPRSLHKLARDALNTISDNPNRAPVNLDGVFPWMQYVYAHRRCFDIIGTGITHAEAVWQAGTNDNNRGGAQRLDFWFYRTNGTVCRVHPGSKRSGDARLIFS